MDYNYELLEILRHHTTLGFKEKLIISKKMENASIRQKILNQKEHCNIGADLEEVYMLEYQFRMRIWHKKTSNLFVKFGKDQDFYDFSLNVLMEMEEKRKQEEKEKKLKRHK